MIDFKVGYLIRRTDTSIVMVALCNSKYPGDLRTHLAQRINAAIMARNLSFDGLTSNRIMI